MLFVTLSQTQCWHRGGHPTDSSAEQLLDNLMKMHDLDKDHIRSQIWQAFAIRRRFLASMGHFLAAFEPIAPFRVRPKPHKAGQRRLASEDRCRPGSATREQTDDYEEPCSATHKSIDPPANLHISCSPCLILTARMSSSSRAYRIAYSAVCV